MARLRLGLDLDGVVYDFHSAARFLLMHYWHLDLPSVDEIWPTWDGHRKYVRPWQEEWLWGAGVDKGLFRHGHVRKGAIDGIYQLDELVDIVIITHRPRQARTDTLDWLAFHKVPAREIHILENQEPKSTVPADFYVDDAAHNVGELLRERPKATVFQWLRAWNRDQVFPGAIRVSDWDTLVSFVNQSVGGPHD